VETVFADHAEDLLRILYLDRSRLAFKQAMVEEELAREFCLRDGEISLLVARAARHPRPSGGRAPGGRPGGRDGPRPPQRPPAPRRHRAPARRTRSAADVPAPGRRDRRATVAESNRSSAEVTSCGEAVLGLDVLYATRTERLDALTFDITTRYQQSTNTLQFALTVVLGSFQAASVAAVIASVAYRQGPLLVLAWAAGTALAAAATITTLLRRHLR